MKLVRDKIPSIMRKKGLKPKTHIAKEEEFQDYLLRKLEEEVQEFINNPSHEELADILEVIDTLHKTKFKKHLVLKVKKKKKAERGSFKKRIILE